MSQEPWPDGDGTAPFSSILGLGVMENHILEETSHHDQKDKDAEFLTTVKRKLSPGTWSLIEFTHITPTNLAISSVCFSGY